jgi:hypothetical protein
MLLIQQWPGGLRARHDAIAPSFDQDPAITPGGSRAPSIICMASA